MIVEKAQVVATDEGYALVNTQRQSACGRCAVNKGCGTSVLSRIVGRCYSQLKIPNRCEAGVGDTVTIGLSEAGLLKSALVVYAAPLLGVIVCVMAGTAVLGSPLPETAGIVLGVTGFALGMGFARWFSAHRAEDPDYHPVMLSVDRLDRRQPAPSGDQGMLAP